jgi:pimeloyl-ACP methyl ester carboxylesterase
MSALLDDPADAPPDYASGPHPDWLDVDWAAHLRWLEVDGRPVNVLDAGSGDPIVFIHGHSACWQHWLEQLPRFMQTNRCIALDLPGFGRSPMPHEDISMSGYADVVDSVMAQLGVDHACVVGNSMGGFVAAELAIRHPHRVNKLVLVAAAGLSGKYIGLPTAVIRHPGLATVSRVALAMTGVPEKRARRLAWRPAGRRFALGFVCTHAELLHPALTLELIRGAGKPGAYPAAVALATYDFEDRVQDIECPTLIVWGDRDHLVPTRCADEYERRIKGARKDIYRDTGHIPMIERPARFNQSLEEFLQS